MNLTKPRNMMRWRALFSPRLSAVIVPLGIALTGCVTKGVPQIDPLHAPIETATLDYWFARPPSAVVTDVDYDRLWKACEAAADSRFFDLERRDYRGGILTTRPLLGGQLLEFWRRDIPDAYSVAESGLATVRRTIQFELRTVGSVIEAYPKVVVERRATQERRVTIGVLNRNALSGASVQGYNDYDPRVPVSPEYWYAVRRDEALEAKLANDVRKRLQKLESAAAAPGPVDVNGQRTARSTPSPSGRGQG